MKEARREENQIANVMATRRDNGVRLVEGPGAQKEWMQVPETDAQGNKLSNTKRRKIHFLSKQDLKRGRKS